MAVSISPVALERTQNEKMLVKQCLEYLVSQESRSWSHQDICGIDKKFEFGSPLPFEFTTIGQLQLEVGSEEIYGRHELAYILSQYYHGEVYAVEIARRELEQLNSSSLIYSVIESLHKDEILHATALKIYLEQRLELFYAVSEPQRTMIETGLKFKNLIYPALGIHVAIEPMALASIVTIKPQIVDPVLTDLLSRIVKDETYHMKIGGWLDAGKTVSDGGLLEQWILSSVAAVRKQSFPIPVYESQFGSGWTKISQRAAQQPLQIKMGKRAALIFGKHVAEIPGLSHLSKKIRNVFEKNYSPEEFLKIQSLGV